MAEVLLGWKMAPKFIWINKQFGALNAQGIRRIAREINVEKNQFHLVIEEYNERQKPIRISFSNESDLNIYYTGMCAHLETYGLIDLETESKKE